MPAAIRLHAREIADTEFELADVRFEGESAHKHLLQCRKSTLEFDLGRGA